MSLHVSNQSSGRRTPQVYQGGFGGTASTVGGAQPNNATNGAGRPTKVKQSLIPVAVDPGTGVSPSMALMTSGGNSNNPSTPSNEMRYQHDHMYVAGVKQQQPESNGAGKESKKATNGNNNTNFASVSSNVSVDKSVLAKASNEKDKDATSTKAVTPAPAESVAKVRDSPRSRSSQQKQLAEESVGGAAPKTTEQLKLSPVVSTPKQQQPAGKPSVVENSLLKEKPLKGFAADGSEMESLLLEPWDYEDSPMPASVKKSRLLRYTGGGMALHTSFNKGSGGDAGDVKLDPVMEQKTPVTDSMEQKQQQQEIGKQTAGEQSSTPSTPTTGEEGLINRPLRSITGRRSTRPISNIMLTHRRSAEQMNDSVSSLNVTVGSDIHNDSLRTPVSSSRKRKDTTPESTSDGPVEGLESPKRARLDFSGFLGLVASPVTMLKNRLSRVKLHSTSTPVGGNEHGLAVEEENPSKVVSAEATTTTTVPATGTNPEDASSKMMVVDVGEEAKEKKDAASTEKSTDDDGPATADTKDDEIHVTYKEKQNQWCSVM
ncbi:uncharacterized protein LOC131210599 [Anopheles bellator]|uniref:uncharacterized protein LOC131210599 n=1 Tax=Anopheles bellator TaxID=139047 RepID=UPI00264725C5|nr:uncharacterized protein LOC131210599 [Anopheles bellator]